MSTSSSSSSAGGGLTTTTTTSMRESQVAAAVTFLTNARVSTSPLARRLAFLEGKGVSPAEIVEALKRTQPQSKEYEIVKEGVEQGKKPSETLPTEQNNSNNNTNNSTTTSGSTSSNAPVYSSTAPASASASASASTSSPSTVSYVNALPPAPAGAVNAAPQIVYVQAPPAPPAPQAQTGTDWRTVGYTSLGVLGALAGGAAIANKMFGYNITRDPNAVQTTGSSNTNNSNNATSRDQTPFNTSQAITAALTGSTLPLPTSSSSSVNSTDYPNVPTSFLSSLGGLTPAQHAQLLALAQAHSNGMAAAQATLEKAGFNVTSPTVTQTEHDVKENNLLTAPKNSSSWDSEHEDEFRSVAFRDLSSKLELVSDRLETLVDLLREQVSDLRKSHVLSEKRNITIETQLRGLSEHQSELLKNMQQQIELIKANAEKESARIKEQELSRNTISSQPKDGDVVNISMSFAPTASSSAAPVAATSTSSSTVTGNITTAASSSVTVASASTISSTPSSTSSSARASPEPKSPEKSPLTSTKASESELAAASSLIGASNFGPAFQPSPFSSTPVTSAVTPTPVQDTPAATSTTTPVVDAGFADSYFTEHRSSMSECLSELSSTPDITLEDQKSCLSAMLLYISNILQNRSQVRYRKILVSNAAYETRVKRFKSAERFLLAAGFELKTPFIEFTVPPTADENGNLPIEALTGSGSSFPAGVTEDLKFKVLQEAQTLLKQNREEIEKKEKEQKEQKEQKE